MYYSIPSEKWILKGISSARTQKLLRPHGPLELIDRAILFASKAPVECKFVGCRRDGYSQYLPLRHNLTLIMICMTSFSTVALDTEHNIISQPSADICIIGN